MYKDVFMWDYLKKAEKPIVLYGMGNNADRVLDRLQTLGISAAGVFASDEFVRGHSFRGFEVSTYAAAKQKFGDMIILLCFGSQLPDVMECIKRIASEQELLVPDMPVAGEDIFDREYYVKNFERLNKVHNLLADEQSRRVFEAVIDFKLSGKIDKLIDCETAPAEAFENIIKPGKSEIFVDLGAYNGDTV
ncbi:MAG: FkbM family methyltransferase, partial [Clostridia bacterium]|nr:FkbM family methyltransferase [Clostridia bacterium]